MNNNAGTVIILIPAFPKDEQDFNWLPAKQQFVHALKNNFPDVQIEVLSFLYPHHTDSYWWKNVRVTAFNGMNAHKFKRLFVWRNIWKKMNALRRKNNIIGIISFWCGECALIGNYFGRRHNIQHYCCICGLDAKKTNKYVKYIRPKSTELIALSDFLVDEFHRNHGIRPAYMISNAIDPAIFSPNPNAVRDIDIMGAGSLLELKRYDLLVDVVKLLHPSFPNLKALICGKGDQKEKLETSIREAGLTNTLSLNGITLHPEVLALMQRTKIFLHTSAYEGFGVVCLEALYTGAHVISFCKPLNYNIPQWHIVKDVEEMAARAKEILEDPATTYRSVLVQSMNDTVTDIMALFNQQ